MRNEPAPYMDCMTNYDETKHTRGGNPANTGEYSAKDHAMPESALPTPKTKTTFTCFGSWANDVLHIDYTVEGEQPDDRPDEINGYQSFSSFAEAATAEEAEQLILVEYDPANNDAIAPTDWEDEFEAILNSEGEREFTSYEDALAAASGNANQVWTMVDNVDFPPGVKIWKFDLDGDEQTTTSDNEEEALELAVEAFNSQYGTDEGDEDNPPVDPDAVFLDEVYTGDISDYTDEWTRLSDTRIIPGQHTVNRVAYLASTAPWTDEHAEYA